MLSFHLGLTSYWRHSIANDDRFRVAAIANRHAIFSSITIFDMNDKIVDVNPRVENLKNLKIWKTMVQQFCKLKIDFFFLAQLVLKFGTLSNNMWSFGFNEIHSKQNKGSCSRVTMLSTQKTWVNKETNSSASSFFSGANSAPFCINLWEWWTSCLPMITYIAHVWRSSIIIHFGHTATYYCSLTMYSMLWFTLAGTEV